MMDCFHKLVAVFFITQTCKAHLHDVIRDLVVSDDGSEIFTESRALFLKSSDKGLSWTRYPQNTLHFYKTNKYRSRFEMSPNFSNDGIMFAMTLNRRTDDGGLNWESQDTSFKPCKAKGSLTFSSSFAKDNTVFVAGQLDGKYKLYRSTEKGEKDTWNEVNLPIKLSACPSQLSVPQVDGDGAVMLLGTSDGTVLSSHDLGVNWNTMVKGAKPLFRMSADVYTSSVLIASRKRVYRLPISNSSSWPLAKSDLELLKLPKENRKLGIQQVVSHVGEDKKTSLFVLRTSCRKKSSCSNSGDDHVLLSHNGGESWSKQFVDDWFSRDRAGKNASHFSDQEFTHVQGVAGTSTVYMGTWTGIYRSDDMGDSWTELDTLARLIIGVSTTAGDINNKNKINVDLCTYTDGCFTANIDVSLLKDNTSAHIPHKKWSTSGTRYTLLERSPNYTQDGVSLYAYYSKASVPFVERCDDQGCNNIQLPVFKGVKASDMDRVFTIRFSPNFAQDNIVYAGGSNTGLAMSDDGGKQFTMLWNALNRSVVQVTLSPTFAEDDTMAVLITEESNRNSDWKVDIYISQNRGETWTLLDSGPYMSVMVSTRQGLTVVALKTNGNVYVNVPKKHNSNKYRMAKVKDLSSTLRPDGIGTTGITMSESGRLLFAYYQGGTVVGDINRDTASLVNVTRSQPAFDKGYSDADVWSFTGQEDLFNKNTKVFKEVVAFSPHYSDDGVLFGASLNELWISFNEGQNWHMIYQIPFRAPRKG
eukprot:m.67655 g.67655  ORF g.67655 m.67655 type:complete len:756 (+) comp11905_c0_seq1:92-2359(+)